MTRWLKAARGAAPSDKTDKTDNTPDPAVKPAVKSVLSVKSGDTDTESDAPDADSVARTPEAIAAVWSESIRRAVAYRKTMKPPRCASCGKFDWRVSVTEIDGRRLHVACWQAETQEADRRLTGGHMPNEKSALNVC